MNAKKFVVDLSTLPLTEVQIKEINEGIGNVVSKVLLENISTKAVKLEPLSKPGGGDTNGYKPVEK